MGEEVKGTTFSRQQRRDYRRKVQLSLDVFENMLAQSSFDFERSLTGMEIECNLVDAQYQPAMANRQVLATIADPAFQTELGAYNIEFNVPPRPLPGESALELEADVRASLNAAEAKAHQHGAHIVMIGILPTLMPNHLTGDWMSESVRYRALNDSIFNARSARPLKFVSMFPTSLGRLTTTQTDPESYQLVDIDSTAEIAKDYQNRAFEDIKVSLNAALDHAKDFAETRVGSEAARDHSGASLNNFLAVLNGAAAEFRAEAIELMKANVITTLKYARELAGATTVAEFVELSSAQAPRQCELILKQSDALKALAQTILKSRSK